MGGAPPVARRVFPVAVRAVVAPSLSSSFKSVRARVGWGRRLPVQLALEVPAAPLAGPGLRGGRLSDAEKKIKKKRSENASCFFFPYSINISFDFYKIKHIYHKYITGYVENVL